MCSIFFDSGEKPPPVWVRGIPICPLPQHNVGTFWSDARKNIKGNQSPSASLYVVSIALQNELIDFSGSTLAT